MSKPNVLYGCETWSMTEKSKKRGRTILRKETGPITEQGVWIIRTNKDLKELYKTPNKTADIKKSDTFC
jgi:hypothetical protein